MIKGQPLGCPFLYPFSKQAGTSGRKAVFPAREGAPDVGKGPSRCMRQLLPRGASRDRREDDQNDRDMIRGSMLNGT